MAWAEWTFHQVCQHCSRLQQRQNKIFQLWWMRWIFRYFQTALLSSQALLHFIVRNFLWRELDTTWFCHALVSAISSARGNSFVPIICQCNNTTAAANTPAGKWLNMLKLYAACRVACIDTPVLSWWHLVGAQDCLKCTAARSVRDNYNELYKQWSKKGSGAGAKTSAGLLGFCSAPRETSPLISWQRRMI